MKRGRRKKHSFVYNPDTHQYWLDGAELPHVTAILKGVGILTGWYGTTGQMRRGKMVHRACHLLNRKNLKWRSVHKSIRGYVRSYQAFLKDSKFKPTASEEILYSVMWRTAGTLDVVGWLRRKRLLLDLKTGGEATPGTGLQTAGYQIMWDERHPKKKIHGRGAVILDPTGEPARLVLFDDPAEIEDFKACRRVYGWKKRHRSGRLC